MSKEGFTVKIYTDGSCVMDKDCIGAHSYIIIMNNGIKETITKNVFSKLGTTSNKEELSGPIAALKYLKEQKALKNYVYNEILVHTDSMYVQKGITIWVTGWKNNGWVKKDGEKVKNRELWEELDSLTKELGVKYIWVKGHADDKYNNECDKIAKDAITQLKEKEKKQS
jgi:ribonuclease HI